MAFDIGDIFVSQRTRRIGFIVPDVVVQEVQNDFLRITDHPVEKGAAISDHAFKVPSEIEMRVGFSNSTGGSESYIDEAYEAFLALQNKREPFDVATGKRAYRNMLITTISVETNETTEHALMMTVGLREVLITQTQTTSGPAKSSDAASQAAPQTTGSVSDGGTRDPAPIANKGSQSATLEATKAAWATNPTPYASVGAGAAPRDGGGKDGWSMVGKFQ